MPMQFYSLLKKRGFSEALIVLGSFDNQEAIQSKFFEKFENEQSYYNAYLRVKKLLLDSGLIKFKLNESNEKVIFLTEKGKKLLGKLKEFDEILNAKED